MTRMRSKLSFDQVPCPDVDISGLDLNKIDEYFGKVGKKVDESKLLSLEILVPYSGKNVCSNGGIILFGKREVREKYFPNATMRCAKFLGEDKVDFLDQYDVSGTILDAMTEVPMFIRRNTYVSSIIRDIRREDIPQFSPIVVREVLTNALVHADYSIHGMNPRVMIFSNRIEIESPGILPFGYTFEDFRFGISHTGNKVITRTFRELQLMEEWGTGYKRIVNACEESHYPIPVWDEVGTCVKVSFKDKGSYPIDQKVNVHSNLTERQNRILSIVKDANRLSSKEIYRTLGEDISPRTLRSELNKLKKSGLIDTAGNGPHTYWIPIQES